MILTYYSKKGGVGKTTILGEHANFLATKGKKVLIISIDDQNSVFEMYGKSSKVFDNDDDYIEHRLAGLKENNEILLKLRDNVYGIKTLNTDMISKKLTLERVFERQFIDLLEELDKEFDYVFVDLPPSGNRATEIVFEVCSQIILIVELNKLGVNGLYNTLQYFTDIGTPIDKVKYVLPNGFSRMKSVPGVALEELNEIVNENLKGVKVLEAVPEKANIQTLQQKGVTIFDKDVSSLTYYQKQQKKLLVEIFAKLFETIKL